MNYTKAQKEVFDALCKGARIGRFALDENHTFVTPNGFMGYIFPNSVINFSLEKASEIGALRVREIVAEENKLELTPDMRLVERNRKVLRRLTGKDKNVFVNVKFLDCFQNPTFYQEASPLSAIIVVEKIRVGGHASQHFSTHPVGIVLPVRCDALQGDYYAWSDAINVG